MEKKNDPEQFIFEEQMEKNKKSLEACKEVSGIDKVELKFLKDLIALGERLEELQKSRIREPIEDK